MIRAAVVGVGNCFAGLVQGIEFYKKHPEKKAIGIMHKKICGYSIHDIEFVAAFDVGRNKVGRPLHEAVYASPNMVDWIPKKDFPKSKVIVKESPTLDGVGIWVQNRVEPVKSKKSISQLKMEILKELKETDTEIIINYLPVGSQKATEFWVQVGLESRCAFINTLPVFIASERKWASKFKREGIPIIGDDVKSQVGATIVHRTLAKLCDDRGAIIDKTYQINVGGNTDFLNMKEQERLQSKKISKTEAVQSQLRHRLPDENIYVGPSDFIPFLGNTKLMFMRIEGRMWADIPFNMDVRLGVDDKANSAGVVIDGIRLAKLAMDRKIGGAVVPASAYLMKHPPVQLADSEAKKILDDFIAGKIYDKISWPF